MSLDYWSGFSDGLSIGMLAAACAVFIVNLCLWVGWKYF